MEKVPESTLFSWMCILPALVIWNAATPAFGWIYPEHRDIAILAVQGLDADHKAVFDRF